MYCGSEKLNSKIKEYISKACFTVLLFLLHRLGKHSTRRIIVPILFHDPTVNSGQNVNEVLKPFEELTKGKSYRFFYQQTREKMQCGLKEMYSVHKRSIEDSGYHIPCFRMFVSFVSRKT
jgi:hypothetical protein